MIRNPQLLVTQTHTRHNTFPWQPHHMNVTIDTHATTEQLLQAVLPVWSLPRLHTEEQTCSELEITASLPYRVVASGGQTRPWGAMEQSTACKVFNTEAEKLAVFKAVARQRSVKHSWQRSFNALKREFAIVLYYL
jgi:hypothetical protein